MSSRAKKEIFSWGKSLLAALGIAFIVRTFVFAPYIVEGASMEPTLHNHEKIFVARLTITGDIKRGEIIIIKGKEENYVKRVIGLPGDTVEMKNDQLLINGEVVKENYLSENRELAKQMGSLLTGDFGPITVPKNKLFVMGDNRLFSKDSRNGLGLIEENAIIGKSEFVFFPFSNIRGTN
ncbi:signal peptidase I [Neobacillus muris]|uniref:signal peptidase I n=1 Tax=Neobacillus muris TaxID=2941334 RepID=UPI00203E2AF1|nr:signal peptidase I [Neobacillus muris]